MTDVSSAIRNLGTSDCKALDIDPHRGPLDEWRAMRERNGCSVAQALGIGTKARFNKEDMVYREPLSKEEEYDKQQEVLGFYRTARAAEICKVNPLWLDYACQCEMLKTSHGYGRGGECKRLRVKLSAVREWQALRLADNNGRPRPM